MLPPARPPETFAAESVSIPRRKVERDLRVSLGLLISGLAIYAVWVGIWLSGLLSAQGGSGFAGLVLFSNVLSGIAGVFILVGAIFSAINWSMLRRQRGRPMA